MRGKGVQPWKFWVREWAQTVGRRGFWGQHPLPRLGRSAPGSDTAHPPPGRPWPLARGLGGEPSALARPAGPFGGGAGLEPCLSRNRAGPAPSGPHNLLKTTWRVLTTRGCSQPDPLWLLILSTCRPPGDVCLSVTRHLLSLLAEVTGQYKTWSPFHLRAHGIDDLIVISFHPHPNSVNSD